MGIGRFGMGGGRGRGGGGKRRIVKGIMCGEALEGGLVLIFSGVVVIVFIVVLSGLLDVGGGYFLLG